MRSGPTVAVPVIQIVVVFPFDDEGARHAVGDVDSGRAVLVRVIPMRARRLAHDQRPAP